MALRKTDQGWQRLIDGSDAWSLPNPFCGPALNDLLDELLAAKEHACKTVNSACKNCRHWGAEYEGACGFIDTIQGVRAASTTGCEIIVTALNDSGLEVNMKTAPNFSSQ